MKYSTMEERRARKLGEALNYKYLYYLEWDYSTLDNFMCRKKNGSRNDITYSEAYIMLDTETSKDHPIEFDKSGKAIEQINHICAFTCSIRAFHKNIVTLRGSKPSELTHMLSLIREHIKADVIFIFVHNLAYDWMFLRRFMFRDFGKPKKQLNVKNHYPITIQFDNGIILRDSLILAGVSLEKWAQNLNVEHQKAMGSWDYDAIRDQNHVFTEEELHYIENDTLAGVECLNALADILGDTVSTLVYTNTGIVRRLIRKIGKNNYAKKLFNDQKITLEECDILEKCFHGGFTHANRGLIGWIINNVKCKDFKSSYPYCMLTCKVPRESFIHIDGSMSIDQILSDDKNAYIGKLIMVKPRLRDINYPMPALQFYKCDCSINAIQDNGRILAADYVEIYVNEVDLKILDQIYISDESYVTDIMAAYKDYIPTWYRDAIFDIFKDKCELEYNIKVLGVGDPSLYCIQKARLNSCYGMAVTKCIKDDIMECYEDDEGNELYSGEYYIDSGKDEKDRSKKRQKKFDKYLNDWNNILPYVWGVYVTSYAMLHLFELSSCIDDLNHHWIYSDTDSIYSDNWNEERVSLYNQHVKDELIKAGYGSVQIQDKEYWLGVAEPDGSYDHFITQGAKRYAVEENGKIKITVAGVPKKSGAACLSRLEDFEEGFIFSGSRTGKSTHTYIYHDIFTDERGNECADSIDLSPADYTLSCVDHVSFSDIFNEEVYYDWFESE